MGFFFFSLAIGAFGYLLSLTFNPYLLNQHCLKSQLELSPWSMRLGLGSLMVLQVLIRPIYSQREKARFMNP